MPFIATITLADATLDGVFTPAGLSFNITDSANAGVYTETIPLGTVQSLPFDLPDASYTATVQLVDTDGTLRGTAITQSFTLPLPGVTTATQVPASIAITAV